MRLNQPVSGREVVVGETANILSTTDLKGTITYANPDFVAISGFSEDELLGQPHNIVRHPDMPEAAFADLWQTLQANRSWMGMVKNRCKNGDHYWVSAFATPVSRDGKVKEYQSVRTRPQSEQIRAAEALYAQLRDGRGMPRLRGTVDLRERVALLAAAGAAGGVIVGTVLATSPIAATLAGLALGGTVAVAVAMTLLPLSRLARQARQVGDNPVSQLIYTGRKDEIGQIEFAMKMLETEAGAMVGRIDLWAVADPVWRYYAQQQGVDESQLQVVLNYRSEPMYLALSPDTPEEVVSRLQNALDEVIAEGYAGCSKTPDLCYLIQNRSKTLAGSR